MKNKFMKLFLVSLLAGMPLLQMAQSEPSRITSQCEQDRIRLDAPYHYCACHEESADIDYSLGFEGEINDTVWFTSSIDQLRQGISAYWFADCSVTMELYVYCTSKDPTIKMTVGKDQMSEKDVEEINRKLDAAGELAQSIVTAVTPHLKVYPNKRADGTQGSGYVYVYPYNQGPNSQCDDPLPVRMGMTYVSSNSEDVYMLTPAYMPTTGKMLIQWKQKQNEPCLVNVRRGSCDADAVVTTQLADSMKILYMDEAFIKQCKTAKDTLYFSFQHDANNTGRVFFHSNPTIARDTVDSVFCQGMSVELRDTILRETTTYTDSLWLATDTLPLRKWLQITQYNLTAEEPDTIYDTISVTSKQLPMLYRNQERINKGGYGDYQFLIHQKGACDTYYFLHVEHKITYTTKTVNQTLCQGKSYTFNGVTYTTDYDLQDSIWLDEDTRAWADIHIHFTPPTMEFDTVTIAPSVLNTANGYYYKPGNTYFKTYGTDTITVTKKNTCTRLISVTRLEGEDPEVPCDPTDPNAPCYVCDPTDPDAPCYECDSTDVNSPCYKEPCDPTDPESDCYDPGEPCDPTDPEGDCYEQPCDPTDPEGDCYECDPTDPEGDCYDDAVENVMEEGRVVRKVQENGMLYIEVNGERFTLLGTRVEK